MVARGHFRTRRSGSVSGRWGVWTLSSPSSCGALPDGVVVTAPDALEKYRFDWTHDATAGTPLAAVRAETTEHVQATMRWASAHGIPVVPRGAGSGLSGGALAVDGGIVLSTERMRAVEIDTASRVAVVEPGALNVEVKRAAAAAGPLVPAGPQLVRDVLDRRQHRDQRRRPVLREVRRHHRLRARPRRRARRRHPR